jgi:hypothetical protein
MSVIIYIAVEGKIDEDILSVIFAQYPTIRVQQCLAKNGKRTLEKNLEKYNQIAQRYPVLVLIDLDQEDCPVTYLQRISPTAKHEQLIIRISVRELEAWLLADRNNFAKFINAPVNKIPYPPDDCPQPKEAILNLVKQYTKNKNLRGDILPEDKTTHKPGRAYGDRLFEFALRHWHIPTARLHSPSLDRALRAVEKFITEK